MTADRIPVADFPYKPGQGVRARDGLHAVADRDGFAFLACCRIHAGAGRWDGGRWPDTADAGTLARAGAREACGRLLTPMEAASALGVSPLTAGRWADDSLAGYRTAGGHRRLDIEEVAALAREGAPAGLLAVPVIRAILGGSLGLARAIASGCDAEALRAAADAGEALAAVCRGLAPDPEADPDPAPGPVPRDAPPACGTGEDGPEARERRLRAWRLAGQPENPRREPRCPREEAVLAAHEAGALTLGGARAAMVTRT